MFVELRELLRSGAIRSGAIRSGAIRRHPLGTLKKLPRHIYTGGII